MSENTSELAKWVDELLNVVFFQPDDEKATAAMEEGFSDDLQVRINGTVIDGASYKKAVAATRTQKDMTVTSNREILASRDPGLGGSVAQLSTFTLKDKKTGEESHEATLTLSTVEVKNGKRVLAQLTEVHRVPV
ncbi:hypothetical protein F5884DRAFT_831013 [Xylogone sp. PMI_703]|nr:hypothetical protein F5884DRAFT_831013 [Xylogone sp. PMI_703]